MGLKTKLQAGDEVWYCRTVPPAVSEGFIVHVDDSRGRLIYHIEDKLSHRIRQVHSSHVFTSEKGAIAKLRLLVHTRLHWERMTIKTLENWLELNKEDS